MIGILDFGSQYTQLIARRVREISVYSEIFPADIAIEKLATKSLTGLILSGGPQSIYDPNAIEFNPRLLELKVPILGICYGLQALVHHFGGKVERCKAHEYGDTPISIIAPDDFFDLSSFIDESHNNNQYQAWMSHSDLVQELPENFKLCAQSANCPIAGCANYELRIWGIQFHPEVEHTPCGKTLLENFCLKICKNPADWTPANFIESSKEQIREQVGNERVMLALSGGVDSAVAAALIAEAVPGQLDCVLIDNGLLRSNESEQVREIFEGHFATKLIVKDAQQYFYKKLAGITDPEQKRKIIGSAFIDCFWQEAEILNEKNPHRWLAQGTIYPDVVESAGAQNNKSHLIKSHHNVGGLPKDMPMQLLEPLRLLFKDEVRKIGALLGLPSSFLARHPFPGPGLAVRIIGEVNQLRVEILRQADQIFISELKDSGYYNQCSQAFAVLLPIKSVGVQGDARSYKNVLALRSVDTGDFMTADWSKLPTDLLMRVSSRICNEVDQIGRVVYDISSKPPATIEWE